MLIYFEGVILIVTTLLMIFSIGSAVILRAGSSELWSGSELLVGYSIGILFLSLYTILPINMALIFMMFNLFGLICIIWWIKRSVFVAPAPIAVCKILVISMPVILFVILVYYYGNNFMVFRGNIWDSFNYNTMAVAYSKYKSSDFEGLIEVANPLSYIAKQNLVQRPSVVLIPAGILSLFTLDSFLLMYFYKAFLLTIFASSLFYFMRCIKLSEVNALLFTIAITFSSWVFYIVEIDALSNLAFVPYVPFIAGHLFKTNNLKEESSYLLFGAILATSFLVYPEFASILNLSLSITLAYSIFKDEKCNIFIRIKGVLICYAIFMMVILLYSEQSIVFLFRQVSGGLQSSANWWGYFGGFILGPDSPVTDPFFVSSFKEEINSGVGLHRVVIKLFQDYFLAIMPSLFGLFHVLRWYLLSIPANFLAIIVFFFSLKWIFNAESKANWLRSSVLILFLIEVVLIFRGNYWSAIKGLSWLLLMLPIVICMTFSELKNRAVKSFFLIFFLMLPLFFTYKYSENNFGIGVYDGFPSILKKSSKVDQVWTFKNEDFKNCKNIFVKGDDPFKRHFFFLHLENYSLNYFSKEPLLQSYGVGEVLSRPAEQLNYDCTVE